MTILTTNFSDFGLREIDLAIELLSAYASSIDPYHTEHYLPDDWVEGSTQVYFNTHSGYVFLSNEDHQVLMLKDRKLEMWYYCSECSMDGFAENIQWNQEECLCGKCAKEKRQANL